MGGFFGVASTEDCVQDLFFGTDYHSHFGTMRGGLAVKNSGGIIRFIKDISNSQFRSKFEDDIKKMYGYRGIGVISDYDDQPLIIRSHLGAYSIVTVGRINNLGSLVEEAFERRSAHFSEMSGGDLNPTEVTAMLINKESNFTDGIARAQEAIDGSCSMLLLTDEGVYAARDRMGRTPVVIGKKPGAWAATMETCAFPNLGYETEHFLGPGEITFINEEGMEQKKAPGERLQICSFLWVYFGYPASHYEKINVEATRYRCGVALANKENREIDMVAGIPDSGTSYAIGFANQAGIPYCRPFVKYTPTWPRSFMPQDQTVRDLVAKMKLIPIRELIEDRRLLFCEDSIVRGTQLQDNIQRLYDYGAKEVHMRPACPPLIRGCKFLNFSRSRSELDLAGRRALSELEGNETKVPAQYSDASSDEFKAMVDRVSDRLRLTSLRYQELGDMVNAIGLPKEKLCTYCWDGVE